MKVTGHPFVEIGQESHSRSMPKGKKKALYFTNPKQLKRSRQMRELRSNTMRLDAGETARVLQFPDIDCVGKQMQRDNSIALQGIVETAMVRGHPNSSSPRACESGSNNGGCTNAHDGGPNEDVTLTVGIWIAWGGIIRVSFLRCRSYL